MELESATVDGNNLKLSFVVPEGADATTFQIIVVPGGDQDRGAVAFLIPQTGKGLVFSEDCPWKSEVVLAGSVQQLADAASELGIELTVPDPPEDFW